MPIAPGADVFFWEGGEIGCSCSLDRAVFWLFGDTDIDINTGGAVRVDCVEKFDPLVFSRSDDAGKLLLFLPFDAPIGMRLSASRQGARRAGVVC
jgi:hypothetical protein